CADRWIVSAVRPRAQSPMSHAPTKPVYSSSSRVRAAHAIRANDTMEGHAMSWSFETDPDFQRELDWIDEFVKEEIEPLDFIIGHPNDFSDPNRAKLIRPLQDEVKKR